MLGKRQTVAIPPTLVTRRHTVTDLLFNVGPRSSVALVDKVYESFCSDFVQFVS